MCELTTKQLFNWVWVLVKYVDLSQGSNIVSVHTLTSPMVTLDCVSTTGPCSKILEYQALSYSAPV